MIKFNLICEGEHEFEAWFKDGASFDTQKKDGALACPFCASYKVEKAVMAPAIPRKSNTQPIKQETVEKAMQMVKSFRKHVTENFDYVGDKFADEARAMHYGDAEERDIYGESEPAEIKELYEEGIDVAPLPGIADKNKN